MPLFDAHLHIIDRQFPLVSNQGYVPEPFTSADYQHRMQAFHLLGGAVVSGSFQGFDQHYLQAALSSLGPGYVGVTQIPLGVADAELHALHQSGVRAVRFNLRRGGSEKLAHLEALAHRVHALLGWHCELYVDARDLTDLQHKLVSLPAVSIDHLGLSKAGLPALLWLVERGIKVKATGFGRLDMAAETAIRAIYSANPAALMFGTDLPSTRAPRPFNDADVTLVLDSLDEAGARRVLYENALAFYRLSKRDMALESG